MNILNIEGQAVLDVVKQCDPYPHEPVIIASNLEF